MEEDQSTYSAATDNIFLELTKEICMLHRGRVASKWTRRLGRRVRRTGKRAREGLRSGLAKLQLPCQVG